MTSSENGSVMTSEGTVDAVEIERKVYLTHELTTSMRVGHYYWKHERSGAYYGC